jgi:hexosaminidase
MRIPLSLVILLAGAPMLAAQTPPTHTLMPVPAHVTLSSAMLRVDSTFSVGITGYRDARLQRAIDRMMRRLEGRYGRPLTRTYADSDKATLVIAVAGQGFAVPQLGEDESYRLDVSSTQAVLTAPTVVGAMHGLETFLQLQTDDSTGVVIQGATIADAPRFPWRGLLLDVSRHFEPVDVVKRTLDGMAMVKLNVLHWHLSDDQGFRVESHVYPRLQELGSDSLFYTQDQIRDVVAYAADRGIRVMPEFDMPGHSSSWFVGYPDLASGPGPFAIARTWGVFAPTMDPTRDSTYQFLDGFIGEMTGLFPDKYWHIGGDEVDADQWKANPVIQAWMQSHGIHDEVALQTAFNKRLFAIVQQHGRIPVGWDEIFQPDLPTSAVIQSWRGTESLAAAAKAGFHAILSAPYYIDHMKPTSEYYLADPIPPTTDLTPEQQSLILGGEACMWGEYVTPATIDSRIWPRLAAIAERLWSPDSVRDVPDMYRRLAVTSRRLEELGLHHEDHSSRLLRRITGDSTPIFESLLRYVRPQDFGGSGRTQFVPHTRLIDAAVADPRHSQLMAHQAVDALHGDSAARTALRTDFAAMADFPARLTDVSSSIPAAADAMPVAAQLKDLGRLGDQALDWLAAGHAADARWPVHADSLLTANAPSRSFGGLRTTVVDAVSTLIAGVKALPPVAARP